MVEHKLSALWSRLVAWYRRCPLLVRWLPVLAWMAVIYLLSTQPSPPELPEPLLDLLIKKAGHMVEYAVLGLLLWQALGFPHPAWAWAPAVLYAASDEFHQTFVAGRHGRASDVLIDAAGAALGLAIGWWLQQAAEKRKR